MTLSTLQPARPLHTPQWPGQHDWLTTSGKAVSAAATTWFVVATLGQLIFVAYILAFYATSALQGNLQGWNKVLQKGYIPGDTLGNLAVVSHILIAAIVTLGGPLQLVAKVRTRPFHR